MRHLALVGLLVVSALPGWAQKPVSGPSRGKVINVGVADFRYQGAAGREWVALGVADQLRQLLGRLSALRVVDGLAWRDQAVARALAPATWAPADLQTLGKDLYLDYVVRGQVEWEEGKEQFTAQAQAVRLSDGKPWREHKRLGTLAGFFDMVSELADLLLDEWGVRPTKEQRQAMLGSLPTRSPLAFEFYCKGLGLYDPASPEAALRVWERALEFDDQCQVVHAAVGRVAYQRAQQLLKQAEESLRRTLAADPANADAHFALGVAYQGRGQHELAETEYVAAIQGNPNHLEAHYNLGVIYLNVRRRYAEARAQFQEVLRMVPEHVDAMNNLGVACYHLGYRDQAVRLWQEALRLDPANSLARSNLERYRGL